MSEIQTPQALIDAAKTYGVDLDSTIKYDAETALHQVADHFNGEADADFGFGLGKFKASIKAAAGVNVKASPLKLKTKMPIVAFVVPKKISIAQAMGGADKLLGDVRIKNTASVITATKALAALGDPAAKRGLATITAVSTIRTTKKTPPGKPAIPMTKPINTKVLTKKYTKATVFNLAQKKLVVDGKAKVNLTLIQKIKKFFGFKI